jgi:hypothetical protein
MAAVVANTLMIKAWLLWLWLKVVKFAEVEDNA